MIYMLDTTLLIDHLRGFEPAVQVFERLFEEGHDLWVCDVVVCEAYSGAGTAERAALAALLEPLEYVSTPPDAARWAGESRRTAGKSSHHTVGDALIGGLAHVSHATVVTRNPGDFTAQGIPVLTYG